jgi:hypothetical protein
VLFIGEELAAQVGKAAAIEDYEDHGQAGMSEKIG